MAGHEVVGATSERSDDDWVFGPDKPTLIDRLRGRGTADRLASKAAEVAAEIYLPTHPSVVEVAARAAGVAPGASVLTAPGWPRASDLDLIDLAPAHPWRSTPASGLGPQFHHRPDDVPDPKPGSGVVAVVYRRTDRNPGRYVESALARAGFDVVRLDVLDWNDVDSNTVAVIVVESPLPSFPVRGQNPGIPVVFWVHHGEHHLDTNLRLQRHYGAHSVALAHSWHLAFRFSGLVERAPFGVPPELFEPHFKPHIERRWDFGFVGAAPTGERYRRRAEVLAHARMRFGDDRVAISHDASPEQLAKIYRDSRIVVDESGDRHLPISMRVFEATGAGALLVTGGAPGLTQVLREGTDYLSSTIDGDVLDHIDRTEPIASSGHALTWRHHTYDHRARQLISIAERIRDEAIHPPEQNEPTTGPASLVATLPDAQRILDLGSGVKSNLPGREVWDYAHAEERAEPRSFHVTVVAGGSRPERVRAVGAARLAVAAPYGLADELEPLVTATHGPTARHDLSQGVLFTFGNSGYRVATQPDPL